MAREESDREDLMREATALVERIEIRLTAYAEPIVVGFRRNGALSLFFGADPVYQFNSQGALRRAYRNGNLVKADDSKLFELRRQRTADQVHLFSREVGPASVETFLAEMKAHLRSLFAALSTGEFEITAQAPIDCRVTERLIPLLDRIIATPIIAKKPHAG